MNRPIFSILLLLTAFIVSGQNPLPALKAYRYITDNNRVDIDKKFNKNLSPVVFTNVYFTYSKNPLYNQTFDPNKIMLFRVQYEHMLQTNISSNNELNFRFRFNKNDDKITNIKLIIYRQLDGKTIEEKVSRKNYERIITDSVIIIKPVSTLLKGNDVLRILLSIESSDINLKDLSTLNKVDNADYYVSFNNPEIFIYIINSTNLDLLEKKETEMRLIKFAYDVSRLTENNYVTSITYNWKIKVGQENAQIIFPLSSIQLPRDIGTSADEIIHKGK